MNCIEQSYLNWIAMLKKQSNGTKTNEYQIELLVLYI